MGGFVKCRWVKLLALLSLVPLALRAGSLLAHVPPPTPSSQPSAAFIAGVVSASAHRHSEVGQRRRRTEGTTLASGLSTATRFRNGGQAGFGDDKRMAPSGSNPLHNLRR